MSESRTTETAHSRRPTVVFDYGGVLTHPVKASIDAWLREDRVTPASLTRMLRSWLSRDAQPDNPLHRLERGELSESEFNLKMASQLTTTDGSRLDPDGLLDRFFAGLQLDDSMLELVRELRGAGVRTVLLSNSWGSDYPWDLLNELFEISVISSQVGLRKPDPQIYRLTAGMASVPVQQLIFIDDGAPNIESARHLGITAHLHVDAMSTRAFLRSVLPDDLTPVDA